MPPGLGRMKKECVGGTGCTLCVPGDPSSKGMACAAKSAQEWRQKGNLKIPARNEEKKSRKVEETGEQLHNVHYCELVLLR